MKKAILLFLFCFTCFTATYAQVASEIDVKLNKVELQHINVFPNPAIDFFSVEGGSDVRKVQIYNLVGNKVKEYYVAVNQKYDVRDLNRGMYLVQFLNENGDILGTKRLSKR